MKSAAFAFAALLAVAPAAAAQEHDHGQHDHAHGAQAGGYDHGDGHGDHVHDAAHYQSAMHAEHVLRDTITAMQAGTPDYDAMSPELAEAVRGQADALGQVLAGLGELQSLEHQGEPQPGTHQFLVTFAGGQTTWFIAINGENRIEGLLFR